MGWKAVFAAWATLLLGCAHVAPPPPLPAPPPLPKVALATLGDELDPGAVEPTFPKLPAPLRAAIEKELPPPADDAARLAAAKQRLERWAESFLPSKRHSSDEPVRRAAEGLYLVEPLAFAPPSPIQREAAALLAHFHFDVKWVGNMRRIMSSLGQMSRLAEMEEASRRLIYANDVLMRIDEAAEKTWKRLAAGLLRDPETAPATLSRLLDYASRTAGDAGDWDRACRLRDDQVRRGGTITPAIWLATADACWAALDLPRGDWAFQFAQTPPGDDDFAARRARTQARRAIAADAARLRGATAVADRARLVEHYVRLHRDAEALALADALVKAHPGDPRAQTARVLADIARLGNAYDFRQMAELVKDLDEVRNRPELDRLYWSLRIGLLGLRMAGLLGEIVRDLASARGKAQHELAELRAAADGLGRFEPGAAAVIKLLVDTFGRELVSYREGDDDRMLRIFRATAIAARALARRHPAAPEPYFLYYAAAIAEEKSGRALSFVESRPSVEPQAAPKLFLERARAYLGLSARQHAFSPRRFARLLAEVPDEANASGDRAILEADGLALAALDGGDSAAWGRAADAYGKVVDRLSSTEQARALNNWGYALHRAGRKDEAVRRLKQALVEGDARWIPRLNLALVQHPDGNARLEAVKKVIDHEGVRAAGWAWEAYLRARGGDLRGAASSAKEALASLQQRRAETAIAWGRHGALIIGSFQVGLGIESHQAGYVLRMTVDHAAWLIEPVPLDEKALRNLADSRAAQLAMAP